MVKPNIRILILSTSDSGGGGISASEIRRQLSSHNIDNILLTRSNIRNVSDTSVIQWYKRILLSKINTYINKVNTNHMYGFTSARSINFVDISTIRNLNPDIVHIHNWYNFLDLRTIESIAREYRVVITSHDTRLLTGGCHVSLGCKNFVAQCVGCPAVKTLKKSVSKSKKQLNEILSQTTNIKIVSPSKWLAELIAENYELKLNDSIQVLPNFINRDFQDVKIVKPKASKMKFLFVASSFDAPFKGGELLVSALNLYTAKKGHGYVPFELRIIGAGHEKFLKAARFDYSTRSNLTSKDLVEEYDNSDLLIVPSLADNYPSVIIESQMMGLPVLATNVGGISELIQDGETGFLASPGEEDLAERLAEITIDQMNYVSVQGFKFANEKFNSEKISTEYFEFYKKAAENV